MIEERDGRYRVIARWRGFPYICATVGRKRADAEAYHGTLKDLRDAARHDILQALANQEVDLQTVHRLVARHGARSLTLEQLGVGVVPEPTLGDLYDDWMAWLKRRGTTSPRTRRPYSARTIRRYSEAWDLLFYFLGGRTDRLSVLTAPRIDEFSAARIDGGASASTVNRDRTAVDSFFHWLADHRAEIKFTRPRLTKFEEPHYDEQERHLEPEEIERVRAHCPAGWWVLVELLYLTGLRVGEAQWLRRRDVDLRAGILNVRESADHRLKSRTSERKVPMAPRVKELVRQLLERPGAPNDFLLPDELRDYDRAYRVFEAACLSAGLHDHGEGHRIRVAAARRDLEERASNGEPIEQAERDALDRLASQKPKLKATRSLHGLRHTFGVACARAGLHPTVIKEFLGHSTVTTTERYMRYALRAEEGQRHARAVEETLRVPHGTREDSQGTAATPEIPQSGRKAIDQKTA